MDHLTLSIGIGLAVSLIFSEIFGVAAGGMVVPGYFALYLMEPASIAVTLAVAFAAFALVRILSSFMIIYGRRRTVLTILIAYLIGVAARRFFQDSFPDAGEGQIVIGFIIPGLIAIWLERQGIIETLCALCVASVVIRLILILVLGEALRTL